MFEERGMKSEVREFIREHREDDVRALALKKVPDGVNLQEALVQIAGWQSARHKIPSWAATEGILYPRHLSMEQCSSDKTAEYKARLLEKRAERRGERFVDLTGGFGVDFVSIAKSLCKDPSSDGCRPVYVERSEELCEIAHNNFPLLGVDAEIVCTSAEEYLRNMTHASVIFLDPARRDGAGRKVAGISDCTPDVLSLKDDLLSKADLVLLKLSPMLDWHKAVSDLGECVREVHIVSVANECKELLIVMGKESPTSPLQVEGESLRGRNILRVICVNDDDEVLTVELDNSHVPAHNLLACSLSLHQESCDRGIYLYEPNASIMKSGCFGALCDKYGVKVVGKNSHLFVSDTPVGCFPGRKFIVEAVSSMNKRDIKENLGGIGKANVSVRNFPMSAEELRRRLKVADGGDDYIFGTTLDDDSHCLLLCKKC